MTDLLGSDLLRLAAAVFIGLTLGALLWGRQAPSAAGSGPLAISAPPGAAPQVTRASLQLTTSCLPEEHRPAEMATGAGLWPASELLASAHLDSLACCTLCHASRGMLSHSHSATLQVVRSCQACHPL